MDRNVRRCRVAHVHSARVADVFERQRRKLREAELDKRARDACRRKIPRLEHHEAEEGVGRGEGGAPGIYVRLDDPFAHNALVGPADPSDPFKGLGKISALGIKVSRHCTYHGLALNVAMDLSPFERINPCGYVGLKTVDLSTIGVQVSWSEAAHLLSQELTALLAP